MTRSTLTRRERVWRIRDAIERLREVRDLLLAAGAPRAAARVRAALTSAAGALRHAETSRSAPEGGELQTEIAVEDRAAAVLEAGSGVRRVLQAGTEDALRELQDELETRPRGKSGPHA